MMLRVGLLIGDDFHAQSIVNTLLRTRKSAGLDLSVFTVERRSEKANNPEMVRWRRLETGLFAALIDCAAPFNVDPLLQVEAHFRAQGAAEVGRVQDINATKFVSFMVAAADLWISIRCYQKFTPSTISALNQRLWNLHPGRLPQYRGVLCYAHQLRRADRVGTHSLHIVGTGWDAGPLIAVNQDVALAGQCLTTSYLSAAIPAAKLLHTQLRKLARCGIENCLATATPQDDAGAEYFSGQDAAAALRDGQPPMLDMDALRSWSIATQGAQLAPDLVRSLRA